MARDRSRIEGAWELNAVLKALPDALARNALAAAGRAGAKEIQTDGFIQLGLAMRSRNPRSNDVLVKKRRTPRDSISATYEIGPPRGKPWLRWLHDGTAPHPITNARRDVLADRFRDEVFGEVVSHPGQPPRQWLKKAYMRGKTRALKAMAQKLATAIPAQARRLVSQKYSQQLLRRRR